MEGLHDRMPVVLEADRVDDWIDPDLVDDRALASLLVAAPAGTLAHHAVDRRVGSIRNDGPDLVEPASD
jgi:putative SOS response-associated peptidase YedK